MPNKLDQIDHRIIEALTANARMPLTDLARTVGLSKTPVAARIKRLESDGIIKGYRAVLSAVSLGLTHVTYVEAKLTDTREKALSAFNDAVHLIPEVEECYMISGGFDYLLKIRTQGMPEFRALMAERISTLPYLASTSSYVSMEAIVEVGF